MADFTSLARTKMYKILHMLVESSDDRDWQPVMTDLASGQEGLHLCGYVCVHTHQFKTLSESEWINEYKRVNKTSWQFKFLPANNLLV